jgi:hypothetical protein
MSQPSSVREIEGRVWKIQLYSEFGKNDVKKVP